MSPLCIVLGLVELVLVLLLGGLMIGFVLGVFAAVVLAAIGIFLALSGGGAPAAVPFMLAAAVCFAFATVCLLLSAPLFAIAIPLGFGLFQRCFP
ncbi:MAG: hypothetical protein U0168_25880 [Nannocystaceae bacterium]|jgi:hypothetical protein